MGGYCQSPRTTTSPAASCGHSGMLTVDDFEVTWTGPLRFGLPVHVDPGVLKLGQIVDLLDLYHYQTSKAMGSENCIPSDPNNPTTGALLAKFIGNGWGRSVAVTACPRFVISRSPVRLRRVAPNFSMTTGSAGKTHACLRPLPILQREVHYSNLGKQFSSVSQFLLANFNMRSSMTLLTVIFLSTMPLRISSSSIV